MSQALTILAITCSFFTAYTSAFVQGNCVEGDAGLQWLDSKLSPKAAISCKGSPLQLYNAGRYWGEQYGRNASVVVFPVTKEDVSFALQASSRTPLGCDLAFVSGAHSQTNASSSTGFVIDLSWMNSTQIIHDAKLDDTKVGTAIAYQGGATWSQIGAATNGSGYTAVGARVGNVGAGGFSTGGGIGYLAGAYGYATDRLRAMEVVLVSGQIVLATKTNAFSDLFWALQGGGGQFGVVTTFYQEAALEPSTSQFGIWVVNDTSLTQAQSNTADFFATNADPFAVMYYATGFLPAQLQTGDVGVQTILVGIRFDNPANPSQASFDATFAPLLANLSFKSNTSYTVPYGYATEVIDPFFPYGFRRGFWGPQTEKISAGYLANATSQLSSYVGSLLANGEVPVSALWAIQYMSPGLNGNLPPSDASTAWPHSVSGHQTLFSPAWNNATDDAVTFASNDKFNQLTWDHQATVGKVLADYPNYISPKVSGERVWGDNVDRLIRVKAKYDPFCRIHQGRVFATAACKANRWANVFPGREGH